MPSRSLKLLKKASVYKQNKFQKEQAMMMKLAIIPHLERLPDFISQGGQGTGFATVTSNPYLSVGYH